MADKEIIIRHAVLDEMPLIIDMMTDVFSGEQKIPPESVSGFLENEYICWCALIDNEICAALAAWYEEDELHMGRFLVLSHLRGKHIGTELVSYAFDELFSNGADKIIMDGRDATVKIVCSMGARVTGDAIEFFEGTVTPMILTKEDYISRKSI